MVQVPFPQVTKSLGLICEQDETPTERVVIRIKRDHAHKVLSRVRTRCVVAKFIMSTHRKLESVRKKKVTNNVPSQRQVPLTSSQSSLPHMQFDFI